MFRKLVICLLLLALGFSAFSATQLPEYVPYGEEEFPEWSRKLRRAEVIALGATAITYPLIGLFAKFDDSKMDGFLIKFGISAAAGAVIALADYIIGEVNANSKSKPQENPPVIFLDPESKEALMLEEMKRAAASRESSDNKDSEVPQDEKESAM